MEPNEQSPRAILRSDEGGQPEAAVIEDHSESDSDDGAGSDEGEPPPDLDLERDERGAAAPSPLAPPPAPPPHSAYAQRRAASSGTDAAGRQSSVSSEPLSRADVERRIARG